MLKNDDVENEEIEPFPNGDEYVEDYDAMDATLGNDSSDHDTSVNEMAFNDLFDDV